MARIALPTLLFLASAVRAEPEAVARLVAAEAELASQVAAARAAALAILFDDERYPVPGKASKGWRVGIDVQPGHREMEDHVSAAVRLHNRWMARVAEELSLRTKTVGLSRPTLEPARVTRSVQYYGIVVPDRGLTKFLKAYRKSDALGGSLRALARRDWKEAAAAGAKLSGAEALLWETLRAAAVLDWNERKGASHDANEKDGVRVINAYRFSLGLPPLILDPQLHFMARDFALEMSRGRFFSHFHPTDPSRRTVGRRASRARYRGAVGENASTTRDGPKAVWRWRADAGHHRLMVREAFRAAGLGCAKVAVLNVGTATRRDILALYGAGDRKSLRGPR